MQLGNWIAEHQHTLVYGGATGGLMTSVAQAVSDARGDIVGVIPDVIVEKGRKSELDMQLFVVDTMSERKELMKEYADVFVVLPGGFGTLDEMFDVVSAAMVGEHDKYTIVFNPNNYWEGLKMMIDKMNAEGTAYKSSERIVFADSIESLYDELDKIDFD